MKAQAELLKITNPLILKCNKLRIIIQHQSYPNGYTDNQVGNTQLKTTIR